MKTQLVLLTIAMALSSGVMADDTPSECQRLSPADAAVLTGPQLQVRYCEAQATYFKGVMAGIKGNPSAKYAACDPAVDNIIKLAKEKGTPIVTAKDGGCK